MKPSAQLLVAAGVFATLSVLLYSLSRLFAPNVLATGAIIISMGFAVVTGHLVYQSWSERLNERKN